MQQSCIAERRRSAENMKMRIYISLVDEGLDVWRPVDADKIDQDTYLIPADTRIPKSEEWQFQPGTRVRCEIMNLSGGKALVAVKAL